MKKTMLAAALGVLFFAGIGQGAVTVRAEKADLTVNCQGTESVEGLAKILADYKEETGVTVQLVSEEGDIQLGDFSTISSLYRQDQLCNLYPYMEEKSPYSDKAAWKEELPGEILETLEIYKKEIPGYPASRSVVRMFCNQELFEKAEAELPKTWEGLIKACRELQDQEISPLVFPGKDAGTPVWQWIVNYLCSQMDMDLAEDLDETDNRYVEQAEACKGVDKGRLDYTQPEIQEAFGFLKELYDLSQGKELGYEEALELFSQGETGIVFASSKDVALLQGDFSIKAVPFPVVTKSADEDGEEREILAGGEPELLYGIHVSLAGDQERLLQAVDVLRYLTSRKVQEEMAVEAQVLPSATEAQLPEEMKDFLVTEEPLRMSFYTGLDEKHREEIWELTREYLEESIEIDALTEKLNQSCQKASKRLREENGWTVVNNYGMPTSGDCTRCTL